MDIYALTGQAELLALRHHKGNDNNLGEWCVGDPTMNRIVQYRRWLDRYMLPNLVPEHNEVNSHATSDVVRVLDHLKGWCMIH